MRTVAGPARVALVAHSFTHVTALPGKAVRVEGAESQLSSGAERISPSSAPGFGFQSTYTQRDYVDFVKEKDVVGKSPILASVSRSNAADTHFASYKECEKASEKGYVVVSSPRDCLEVSPAPSSVDASQEDEISGKTSAYFESLLDHHHFTQEEEEKDKLVKQVDKDMNRLSTYISHGISAHGGEHRVISGKQSTFSAITRKVLFAFDAFLALNKVPDAVSGNVMGYIQGMDAYLYSLLVKDVTGFMGTQIRNGSGNKSLDAGFAEMPYLLVNHNQAASDADASYVQSDAVLSQFSHNVKFARGPTPGIGTNTVSLLGEEYRRGKMANFQKDHPFDEGSSSLAGIPLEIHVPHDCALHHLTDPASCNDLSKTSFAALMPFGQSLFHLDLEAFLLMKNTPAGTARETVAALELVSEFAVSNKEIFSAALGELKEGTDASEVAASLAASVYDGFDPAFFTLKNAFERFIPAFKRALSEHADATREMETEVPTDIVVVKGPLSPLAAVKEAKLDVIAESYFREFLFQMFELNFISEFQSADARNTAGSNALMHSFFSLEPALKAVCADTVRDFTPLPAGSSVFLPSSSPSLRGAVDLEESFETVGEECDSTCALKKFEESEAIFKKKLSRASELLTFQVNDPERETAMLVLSGKMRALFMGELKKINFSSLNSVFASTFTEHVARKTALGENSSAVEARSFLNSELAEIEKDAKKKIGGESSVSVSSALSSSSSEEGEEAAARELFNREASRKNFSIAQSLLALPYLSSLVAEDRSSDNMYCPLFRA